MGECAHVRLNIQHFRIANELLKLIITETICKERRDVVLKELFDCFKFIWLQIVYSLTIHEKSQELVFLQATLLFTFAFILILDFGIEQFLDDIFERDQSNLLK